MINLPCTISTCIHVHMMRQKYKVQSTTLRRRASYSIKINALLWDKTPQIWLLKIMVKDFRLELNYQGVQVTPREVSGTVVVVTDEAKPYNAITVTLRGYADVYWTESSGSGENETTHSYGAHEDYINEIIVLWNVEQIPNRVLNPGQYVFPFKFVMRSDRLPSSVEGLCGKIRYEVEARICSTGLFHFDKKVLVIIQVVDRVDINDPALMNPAQFVEEKTICCLCCASPPISLTANVPRTGFCIGERIPFTASLDNSSGRAISLRAILGMIVTFRAERNLTRSTQELGAFQSPPVQGHTTFQWTPTEQLVIPPAIPTVANCGIISLHYYLIIQAIIPHATNATIYIPITVGNVPPAQAQFVGPQPLPPPQYPPLNVNKYSPLFGNNLLDNYELNVKLAGR